MAKQKREPIRRATKPFLRDGEEEFVEVIDGRVVRRCLGRSAEVVEEIVCPITSCGCYIHEVTASPSGAWVVTQRISGQGEWGYDVFRTSPLARVAGIAQEKGYILEVPSFAADESWLVGAASACLGGWWSYPWGDPDEAARGGAVSFGFLFVHRLPSHSVTRHELRVELPAGWLPDDPWKDWHGPRAVASSAGGVRLEPSWGVPVEVADPLPPVIVLPAPSPSGKGLL